MNLERKKDIKPILLFILVLSLLLPSLLSGCIEDHLILDTAEITNYQGVDLSSINDFRENSIKGPQYLNATNYRLKITGLVDNPQNLSLTQINTTYQSYKKVVTLLCVEGWDVTILWEGYLIADLLETAELQANATTAIFHAYDGYTTSLPLSYIQENDILLAHSMNNVTLPPERGFPFQLVAESKWGYKWIKWVVEIEITNDEDYRGYWESRGYSNTANINQSFFDLIG